MRRNGLRVLGGSACVGVVLTLSACGAPAALSELKQLSQFPSVATYQEQSLRSLKAQVSNDALVKAGTLTIGLPSSSQRAPMSFKNQDGELAGLDYDVAAALGEQLGLPVAFVTVSGPKDLGVTCDVLMDQRTGDDSQTLGAAANVSFHDGYAADALCVFARKETQLTSATDLVGAVVGVQSGSASQETLQDLELGVSERGYANLEDAFYALEAGDVSYVVCDALCGAYTASNLHDIAFVGVLSEPVPVGVATLSKNTELSQAVDTALTKMKTSNRMQLLRSFWLGAAAEMENQLVVSGIEEAQAKAKAQNASQATTENDTEGTDSNGGSDGDSDTEGSDNAGEKNSGSSSSSSRQQGSKANGSDKQDGSNAGANAVVISEDN